jgi:hypothetical protein
MERYLLSVFSECYWRMGGVLIGKGFPLSWSSFYLYCNATRYIMPASAVQIFGTTFTREALNPDHT